MNRRNVICCLVTLRKHWFKHYPGKRRYVHCRICGVLPKGQWAELQRLRGRFMHKLWKWLIVCALLSLLLLIQGCQDGMSLRFSPTEAQRQNSEMTYELAKTVHAGGADAGSIATVQLVAGTEASLMYTGRSKTPVDVSQFPTVNAQAKDDAAERPNIEEASNAALELGLGVLTLFGGAASVKLASSLRRMHGKAKAFQEVVSKNQMFKRMATPEMVEMFKTANKKQSAATRVLVAEAKVVDGNRIAAFTG
ncbi:hypothetical protein LCGC14_2368460, partial [marine sediment metagenome]